MGTIADKVATMRGCSLAEIVAEIARMEDGSLFALEPETHATDPVKEEFENEFWPCYPHKTGKPVAMRAFIKARKIHDLDVIMRGLGRYLDGKPADRPWLNPSTFLNQARYLDQPAALGPKPGNTSELRHDLRNRIGERSTDTGPVRRLPQREALR
jgi:hypothetical protein